MSDFSAEVGMRRSASRDAMAGPAAAPDAWSRLAPLLVFALALGIYLIGLGRSTGAFDEYYHVLAAKGWLATGTPRILDGLYTRAELYTILVAETFRLLGQSLWAARLPSALASAALVTALFLWLRAHAGPGAAWLGAALLAISPFTIESAHFARFYAVQCLTFLLGVIAVEMATAPGRRWPARVALGAFAVLSLALALYFQMTTAVGLVGLGVWLALGPGLAWLLTLRPRQRWLVALALVLLGLVMLAGVVASGLARELLFQFRYTPTWAQEGKNQVWFYYLQLLLNYPALLPFGPLLALLAVALRPRLGGLALAILGVALVLHSLAGLKSMKYLAYAFPFLWALVAVALVELWPGFRRFCGGLGHRLAVLVGRPGLGPALGVTIPALGLLFAVVANPAVAHSIALLAGLTLPGQEPPARWQKVAPILAPLARDAGIVVDTSELETLYYLGRHDVLISRSRLSEMPLFGRPNRAFEIDPRVGRPVIGEAPALARIMDCRASGLVVSSASRLASPLLVDPAIPHLLAERGQPVLLPPGSHILAWVWHTPAAALASKADCAVLAGVAGKAGAAATATAPADPSSSP